MVGLHVPLKTWSMKGSTGFLFFFGNTWAFPMRLRRKTVTRPLFRKHGTKFNHFWDDGGEEGRETHERVGYRGESGEAYLESSIEKAGELKETKRVSRRKEDRKKGDKSWRRERQTGPTPNSKDRRETKIGLWMERG